MDSTVLIKILLSDFERLESASSFDIIKVEPNDSELFEGDEKYSELMKAYRVASKELRDYKFNIRNNYKK